MLILECVISGPRYRTTSFLQPCRIGLLACPVERSSTGRASRALQAGGLRYIYTRAGLERADRIFWAQAGITVPGPKTPMTPAAYR
jgi:hypothetical protein